MRRLLFLLFLTGSGGWLQAQQTDTLQVIRDTVPASAIDSVLSNQKKSKMNLAADTSGIVENKSLDAKKEKNGFLYRFFVKKYPNPRAAAVLSFVLPGAGQIYNKKWWKLPIVYGALGGMTWLAVTNDKQYKELRTNYKWLVDGDETTNPVNEPYIYMSETQMKSYRDLFRNYTEKSYLFLGVTYLLVVTDAFVDAHLATFDVSDDLSLRIVPDIQSGSGSIGASFGVGIRLGFGRAPSRP
ncbi:MAG: hypothetical protein KDC86_06555 [Saprospiraceae bacterium]|nr:hypothetical protein [Saprospiraceae bacterium]